MVSNSDKKKIKHKFSKLIRSTYTVNSFYATGLFLYLLNVSEKLCFYVFREYRKRPVP